MSALSYALHLAARLAALAITLLLVLVAAVTFLRSPDPDIWDYLAVFPALLIVVWRHALFEELDTWLARIVRD